jgi:hypothetical protein
VRPAACARRAGRRGRGAWREGEKGWAREPRRCGDDRRDKARRREGRRARGQGANEHTLKHKTSTHLPPPYVICPANRGCAMPYPPPYCGHMCAPGGPAA